ncbi:MAG TPA: NAD-glutamate dehydrogenase domain-containing protein [Acidimicrobiia bacterium]|nr:NAD-glutamate dehydrogenase domain-containing protein [Acidimicrobiia bacterium]
MDSIDQHLSPGEDLEPALAAFAQAFVRRITDERVAALSDDAVFAEMRSVFDLMANRMPGIAAIRVFNPNREIDGYQQDGTVIDIVVDDSPFIVDSTIAAIENAGYRTTLDSHVVMAVERDGSGRLVEVGHAREGERRESTQHYVLDRVLDGEEMETLRRSIEAVLEDVRLAVRDFKPMLDDAIARMIELARRGESRYGRDAVEESVELLKWLRELNFVFLGYREYDVVEVGGERCLVADADSGLGILSDASTSRFAEPVPIAGLPEELQARYREGFLLVVAKTNSLSTVHRPVRMDYVGVRVVDADGVVVGEARLLGLFTSHAYMTEPDSIPILRRKLEAVLEAEDLVEGSHDYRAVVRLFNSFPQSDLWSMPVEAIKTAMEGLLAVETRDHVRLFVSPDLLSRSVSLMVVLPRDRFTATLRARLESYFVERYHGTSADYQLTEGADGMARIHFRVWVDGPVLDVPLDELQHTVIELSRTWEDRLIDRLGTMVDDPEALLSRWSPTLPDYYKTSTNLGIAAGDICQLEELASSGASFRVGLQNEEDGDHALTRAAVYTNQYRLELSEILPLLESAGLRIVQEVPTRLEGDGDAMFIHDVGVLGPDGQMLDVQRCRSRLTAAIEAGLANKTEIDSLDRLIVLTDLTHDQVSLLRVYRTYRRRVGSSFTERYTNDTLVAHPRISELLVELFERRFDPSATGRGWEDVEAEILRLLGEVSSLEEDTILRDFLEMILATVRTNAYKPGRDSLSLKLWSPAVPAMPDPKPLFEIFVSAPHVEGIHLRGGKVARGGIRWSDRREDYRAEVLGLMKAQMTKNALIVPTGAKGGFVLRKPAQGADLAGAVQAAYRTFIRGLLDVTDNLIAGEVVGPPHVRRHDGDDPYLVAAADRGTAAFSDTANEIAASYGFWLDDAFASGGSQGYDHKALAITARGAWESVKRHFADMSIDVDSEQISVVGIGDMSGDVFGNGMLQSPRLRLVAAFDHRDIFLDPDPPDTAFAERQRLFSSPGSTWQDYDRSIISSGGGVWSRKVKRIDLSDQVRSILGTEVTSATPAELISVILKAPVDLLWNGGIGTYVKASTESHSDCQDRSNDPVRIDAAALRCSVVGEGGNLGFTQRGRIEFASSGGRINTDFIDNSGGVDCSDREVNLKILLGMAETAGELDRSERAKLVLDSTADVVARVLEDNHDQALVLTQEEDWSTANVDAYEHLMRSLEAHEILDRTLESLPGSDEMVERGRDGRGMTRPELAVLLAYAKQDLKSALIDSDDLDNRTLVDELTAYFPDGVARRFAHHLWQHPLRREILATVLASRVVNGQGVTFVNRLVMETGSTQPRVVAAYGAARKLLGADERLSTVERLEPTLDAALRRQMLEAIDWLVESVTRWYLAESRPIPTADQLDADRLALAELESFLADPQWSTLTEDTGEVESLTEAGISAALARRHARHDELVHAPDIIELARTRERGVGDVARLFLLIGDRYRLDWLERQLGSVAASSRWQKWAVRTIHRDLIELRRELAEKVLDSGEGLSAEDALEQYRLERRDRHIRLDEFMQSVAQEEATSLDPLLVAARQIRELCG